MTNLQPFPRSLILRVAQVVCRRRQQMVSAAQAENFEAAQRHQKHAAIVYAEMLAAFSAEFGTSFDRAEFDRACGLSSTSTSTPAQDASR